MKLLQFYNLQVQHPYKKKKKKRFFASSTASAIFTGLSKQINIRLDEVLKKETPQNTKGSLHLAAKTGVEHKVFDQIMWRVLFPFDLREHGSSVRR